MVNDLVGAIQRRFYMFFDFVGAVGRMAPWFLARRTYPGSYRLFRRHVVPCPLPARFLVHATWKYVRSAAWSEPQVEMITWSPEGTSSRSIPTP